MAHLVSFDGISPRIATSAWVAPTAVLIGDVEVGADTSIWFGAVLRADLDSVILGPATSVQDNVVLHAGPGHPTRIGARVTLGHGAILEGCVVGDGTLIGMGAVVLQDARIGAGSLVAAGSTVPERANIPAGVIAAGVPARVIKPLDGDAKRRVEDAADAYRALAARYRSARFEHLTAEDASQVMSAHARGDAR